MRDDHYCMAFFLATGLLGSVLSLDFLLFEGSQLEAYFGIIFCLASLYFAYQAEKCKLNQMKGVYDGKEEKSNV